MAIHFVCEWITWLHIPYRKKENHQFYTFFKALTHTYSLINLKIFFFFFAMFVRGTCDPGEYEGVMDDSRETSAGGLKTGEMSESVLFSITFLKPSLLWSSLSKVETFEWNQKWWWKIYVNLEWNQKIKLNSLHRKSDSLKWSSV